MIGRDKSIIPACDVETLEEYEQLVRATSDIEGIGGDIADAVVAVVILALQNHDTVAVAEAVTGQVQGQHLESSAGEPCSLPTPSVEVATGLVEEHDRWSAV